MNIRHIIYVLFIMLLGTLLVPFFAFLVNAQEPDRFVLFTEGDLEQILVLDPTSQDSCGILIHEPGTAKIPAGNKLIITGVFGADDLVPKFSVSMVVTGPKPHVGPLTAEVNFIDAENNITKPWRFNAHVSEVPGGVIIFTQATYEQIDAFITDMMENPFVTLGQGSNLYYRWSTEWIEEGMYAFLTCVEQIQPFEDSVQPSKGDDL